MPTIRSTTPLLLALAGLATAATLTACTIDRPDRAAYHGPLAAAAKGGLPLLRWEEAYQEGFEPWQVLDYPEAPADDVVDTIHGVEVADPYRYMEDPDDARLADWAERQDVLFDHIIEHAGNRGAYLERLTALYDSPRYGTPRERGGRYFFTYNDGLQNQSELRVSTTEKGDGRLLLDPNTWSDEGTISLGGWTPSEDGTMLAYLVQEGGSDWRTIKAMDVATGEDLGVEIEEAKFSGITWAKDGSGFYYSRYPEKPTGSAELTSLNQDQKVYFHRMTETEGGSIAWEDELVWETPDHPNRGWGASLTDDGRFLMVYGSETTAPQNLLYVKDLTGTTPGMEDFRPIISEFEARYSVLGSVPVMAGTQEGHEPARLIVYTTDDAPFGRVISIDPANPGRENWTEVIPEGDVAMQGASMVGGHIITRALRDVLPEVNVYTPSGELVRTVELPGVGSAFGFGGRQSDTYTYYGFSSFAQPSTTYRYDIASGESTVFRESEVDFDSEPYVTRQVFYSSKDGTRVPMFITHKKDAKLDGSNKTLLYGYGGFGIPLTPGFSTSRAAWLESGGIYAVANLRGGAEYGLPWREAGSRLVKQNTFDDFIAAAEFLQANGYTSPEKTAIMGGSNGGLLVGACLTQRPELFGAAIPQVGVLDMLRFHLFSAGRFWVSDYGSADDPEQFEALYAYSPYHNVRKGVSYPPTMITTAYRDDRVVPMHSFKFAAALQKATGSPDPILIRIERDAGHGAGTSVTKQLEAYADIWAFVDMVMGEEGEE
ncbi:MAG: prolyl oligopeptidase family serine peptidase [Phycisphaera sp.]|nr:MAG: prolyl oligopeptidase family serine peptidase [Phycisphaera sp.]